MTIATPIGVSIDRGNMPNPAQLKAIGVSSWVPENAGKWAAQWKNGNWDFSGLDALISAYRDFRPRFHNGVWHKALPPDLVVTKDNWLSLIKGRFEAIEKHYGSDWSKFSSVDVVNEPFLGYARGAATGFIRPSVWYDAGGPRWWWEPFKLLGKAKARLIVNDFEWIESSRPDQGHKFDAGLAEVRAALEAGVRIDGVGQQLHVRADWPFDAALLAERCKAWTALGLSVEITEANVLVPTGLSRSQAAAYLAQIIKVCRDNANVPGITFWSTFNTWGAAAGQVMTYVEHGMPTELTTAVAAIY